MSDLTQNTATTRQSAFQEAGNETVKDEDDSGSPEEEVAQELNLNAPDPIPLSQFLALKTPINDKIVKIFQDNAVKICAQPRPKAAERRWLADYCNNVQQLLQLSTTSKPPTQSVTFDSETSRRNLLDPIHSEQERAKLDVYKIPAIKLNELVKKPEAFNGLKPPPRRWLDDYEKAADVNGWTEALMVKYFSHFLERGANDWYLGQAVKRLGPNPAWADLRAAFIKYYLGGSDKVVLRRELEKTKQGDTEKATNFIARYLRLIELVDPNKDEEELVDLVRSKLKPGHQDKLLLTPTVTIEELNDACLRIEAAEVSKQQQTTSKIKDKSERKTERNGSDKDKQQSKSQRGAKQSSRKDKSKCLRCDRKGHMAEKCFANAKWNGEPCNAGFAKAIKAERQTTKVSSVHELGPNADTTATDKAAVVARIRAAGTHAISTVQVNNLHQLDSRALITFPIKCNGVGLLALIDTGAAVSLISHEVVRTNKWTVQHSDVQLAHAAGEHLNCVGEIDASVEVKIGFKFMVSSHKLVVVDNLISEMIFGVNLIRDFKLIISPTSKSPMMFQKGTFKRGVRLAETIVVPARHMMLTRGRVTTAAKFIATVPFQFDTSILVANSVSRVTNEMVPILVVNIDTWSIEIKSNQQVASYQPLDTVVEENALSVNSVLQLADTSSFVNVGEELTNEQLASLAKLLEENKDAFCTDGKLGFTTLTEHRIELVPEAKPFREKARRHPLKHVEEAKRQIAQMLKEDIVRPSSSPWCSEFVMVKKKTGDWRMCVDFRRLNTLTKKDAYPLPNIDECLEQLSGNQYFSQMDFASGYWQLPMAKDSMEYTAFRVDGEIYDFKRLPFGLTNSPATYQRLMNALFAGMKGMHLQIFLDDICLATETWQQHLQLLEQVFAIVIKANLRLKGSKCTFGTRKVKFLGHEISQLGMRPDSGKVEAINQLPPPFDASGVRRVLGAFGYYRKFIPRFAELAEPLLRLTRKNNTFNWGNEEQTAFDQMKTELANCITLTNLNSVDPIHLKTDASLIGVAGILLQEQHGELKIVACASRHLKPAEKNYSPMEIKALAVIFSLKKFRHYLLGRHFKIVTDHCALKVLNSRTTRNARVERWALALAEFDYEILYQKGKLHEDVDCLSRAPVEHIAALTQVTPLDVPSWTRNYTDPESNEFLQKAREAKENFQLKGELIYFKNKLFVPKDLQKKVLEEAHSSELAAHDGIEGTTQRLADFWWPDCHKEIEQFVRNCNECQRRKVERRTSAGMMRQHDSFQPMQIVAFDYLGPLSETLAKKRFVIVAVDHFTRFVEAKAVKDQVAERFVKFFSNFCCRFGIPGTIVTDNAKQFDNKSLDAVREQFGTMHQISPPGHSRGNSICERTIESLSDKLATIINNATTRLDWETALPFVVFSINSKIHSSTGYAPFELLYGRAAPLVVRGIQRNINAHDLHAETLRLTLESLRSDAIANAYDAHQSAKRRFDEQHRQVEFDVNDLVLIKVKSRSAKLGPKFEGPYRITNKNNDIYDLVNMSNPRDKRRRHVSQMKIYSAAAAVAVALIIATPTTGRSSALHETLPIYWQESREHAVSDGEETLRYLLQYVSPCPLIRDFGRLLERTGTNVVAAPAGQQARGTAAAANLPQSNGAFRTAVEVQPTGELTPIKNVQVSGRIQPAAIDAMQQVRGPAAGHYQAQPPPIQATPVLEYRTPVGDPSYGDDIIDEDDYAQEGEGQWVSNDEAEQLNIPTNQRGKRSLSFAQQAHLLANQCESVFSQSILALIDRYAHGGRPKRQIGFISGYIISNIISEVKQIWSGRTDANEFRQEYQNSVKLLNAESTLLSTAMKELNKNQAKIQKEIEVIQYQLDRLPNLEQFSAYIVTEIEQKKTILEQFLIGLQQGKTNTVLLSQCLNTQVLDKLEVRDADVTRVQKLDKGGIEITLNGHIRSQTTKVFDVKFVSYYTDWKPTSAVRNDYLGKHMLIYNMSSVCVKGVDETTKLFVEEECTVKNGKDPQLELWRKTPIELSKETRHSQYAKAGKLFIISCWGNNITYRQLGSAFATKTICPTYPFILNETFSFSTSDNMVKHVSKPTTSKQVDFQIITEVMDFHFPSGYKRAHEVIDEQIGYITNVLNQHDRLNSEVNATIISGQTVTWKHLAVTGGGSTGVILVMGLCVVLYYKCRPQMPSFNYSFWPSRTDQVEHEIRREVSRQIKREADEIEMEVRREVKKEVTREVTKQVGEATRQVANDFNEVLATQLHAIAMAPSTSGRRSSNRRNLFGNIAVEEIEEEGRRPFNAGNVTRHAQLPYSGTTRYV